MHNLKDLSRYVLACSILNKNSFPKVVNRPIIKETVFMPDRKAPPPIASTRDMYTVCIIILT